MDRRQFLQNTAAGSTLALAATALAKEEPRTLRLWVSACAHVGTDLRRKRESLADAIRHSEQGGPGDAPTFDWDAALVLGDLSGNQGSPSDEEGREVIRQFAAARKHRREHFYCIAGNHDASGPGELSMGWFQKWIDPEGKHTEFSGVDASRRPFPIEGNWERYAIQIGNVRVLMMSDRNDGGPPVGRDKVGGYPAGAVKGETFAWWKQQVESHADEIVVTAHHHMLKETTVASGEWEGFRKRNDGSYVSHYHGYFPKGGPKGASYLYWLDNQPDAQAFERYLKEHPAAIDLWLGGHTHTNPDDRKGGRSHVEQKWGVTFVNCSALSQYHGKTNVPMSRLFTFTEGSRDVRIQCYMHTAQHAPVGWYAKAERTVQIRQPFAWK